MSQVYFLQAADLSGRNFLMNSQDFCASRKVFAGQNLYVKGAVLGACTKVKQILPPDTILACKNPGLQLV